MITIDGSFGEGGGQILRSSLTLSILTQKPFEINNIRANRKRPGMSPQHVKAVEAAATIARAEVTGLHLSSKELKFVPTDFLPGEYMFQITTAGSTSLVLQTIYLPLAMAPKRSRIVITGGTHVAWSPTYHYLTYQWLPFMRSIGFNTKLKLVRAGFFPKGEGKIIAEILPVDAEMFKPVEMIERGEFQKIRGVSAVANLDYNIAQRQRHQAERRMKQMGYYCHIKNEQMRSRYKSTAFLLAAEFENGRGCFSSLGAIGKRAEKVADEVVNELKQFLASTGCVDKYMADQLILPLAFIKKKSIFKTSIITEHLLTIIEVTKKFLDVTINVEGELGQEGIVEIY